MNKKKALATIIAALSSGGLTATAYAEISVNYSINPEQTHHSISPLIYGTNQNMPMHGVENFGFYRIGGNRMTGYNWETNYSSAGSDWKHVNDLYMLPAGADQKETAVTYTHFLEQEVKNNAKALLTLQMAGYVSADDKNEVSEAETAPSNRWIPAYARKNAPFSLTPDLNDNAVYIDEMVNFLVQKYGRADEGGVWAWSLDNEPSLWNHTHPRIHPNAVGIEELVNKGIEFASATKDVDDSAKIFGPAFYGMSANVDLMQSEDWKNYANTYKWYVDYYLDKMKEASDGKGQRLLDVIDFHWYSEAKGESRVIDQAATKREDLLARLQSPRTLWDAGFAEPSWIGQYMQNYLPLIPTIQHSIDTYYPGTGIAFTEYSFGGGNDITGGVTQADVLGIFGDQNVYAANHWLSPFEHDNFISGAFRLYRNYDGNNSTFGDLNIDADMSDKENSSIYAALNSKTNSLHVIVLNKNLDEGLKGTFTIEGDQQYQSAGVYALAGTTYDIQPMSNIEVSGNAFDYELPAISAYHFVLEPAQANDNSGSDNSGSDNSGSDNSGSDNSGSDNSGSDNSGSDNSGSDNSGSDNSGSDNSGSDNSGSDNSDTGSDDNSSDNGNDSGSTPETGGSKESSSSSISIGSLNPVLFALLLGGLFWRRRK